ncbi:MAG: sel1 repeat family protein, partial [Lentisphaeria bacterium]|nr:sel1 repeat family protein [Lentisphaeria bacterium]
MYKTLTVTLMLTLVSNNGFSGLEQFNSAKLAVESGNKDAQYKLAMFYQEGDGCKVDQALAKKYFTLSAEQGNSDAQYMLG